MKNAEAEKPEYVYRPTIYFHAADDGEAKTRITHIRHVIEKALADNDLRLDKFTYDDVENQADCLQQREQIGQPNRVVA